MISLLLVVFFLQLTIYLINTFGVTVINTVAWNLYNRLPTPTAKEFKAQKAQQAEYVTLRRQLAATSAQNEFSKWAKLQRQVDKLTVQLEKQKAGLEASKAQFDKIINGARWLGTTGMRMLLQFWFTKQPMFWLPHGFVPYYGEWILSFPRAPLGSVSIQVWGMACGAAILLVSEAVVAVVGLVMEMKNKQPVKKGNKEKVPMKMKAEPQKVSMEEKKEL